MNTPDLSKVIYRKSRRSYDQGGCVEVGAIPGADRAIALRDSKNLDEPAFVLGQGAFRCLLASLRDQ